MAWRIRHLRINLRNHAWARNSLEDNSIHEREKLFHRSMEENNIGKRNNNAQIYVNLPYPSRIRSLVNK